MRALAALIASGINAAGYRAMLGIQLGDSESESSWSTIFAWLKRRGLSGVDLVVCDAHPGLVAAVQRRFQGCTWRRCQTHLAGDVLFAAPDLSTARVLVEHRLATSGTRAPTALATLEAGFDDATAVLAQPNPTGDGREPRTESNGSTKRRRRERVIRIVPNRESAIRLLGAVLLERHEQWTTGYRYVDMAGYWPWRGEPPSEPTGRASRVAPARTA